MRNKAKVASTDIASSVIARTFGAITHTTRAARMELGELPIFYVKTLGRRTAAVVPPWIGEWLEANADAVLESITLTRSDN